MNKEQCLEILKLLSSIEGWCFSTKERLPDHLLERLNEVVELLSKEVLK